MQDFAEHRLQTLAVTQRCKTAREAIHFIDEILSQYGYASSGESVSIADTKEVTDQAPCGF